jgi:hypothetical protein
MSASTALVAKIETLLKRPVYFSELLDALREQSYRDVLKAWSAVRQRHQLDRDERGRYWLTGSRL